LGFVSDFVLRISCFLPLIAVLLGVAGCRRDPAREPVVVYCAHDREFADEILKQFTSDTGIEVVPRYDTEANKSVGLYEDLVREAGHPRCDVHWNNEILATIRLQKKGILAPYASPAAAPYPARFKATDATWTAFAARARILLVNTQRVKETLPKTLDDLTRPEWKGRVALAKPLFGTTATQAACLFAAWGEEKATDLYRRLHANDVRIVPGNKQVAVGVGAGQFDLGLTDTDDAFAEIDAGRPVTIVYLDETLFIPNTVALIKNCPHPDRGKQLIDYLLSPAVETRLAQSKSRQIPLNPEVKIGLPKLLQTPQTVRPLAVDFEQAAEMWPESQAFLAKEFALR
jgi:iron(III) transport system substrate-binding protein